MTGAEALRAAIPRLRAAGVEDPARDARLLLAHALAIGPDRLTLHLSDEMSKPQAQTYEEAILARLERRPVAQITGRRLFWGLSFRVTADTLDPRPETECLVAEALSEPFSRVLDLGTGTGCILLSLLSARPGATGLGIDISAPALDVARSNARALGLEARVTLAQGNWLEGISGPFDLVVSNPPYIALAEMADLAPEVRAHEPHQALTDGSDGLTAYRAIAAGIGGCLAPGGRLLVEIGPTQGQAVAALLSGAGLAGVRVLPDLDGRDRVVTGRMPG